MGDGSFTDPETTPEHRDDGQDGDDEVIGGLGNDRITDGSGNDISDRGMGTDSRAFNADGTPRINKNGSWHRDVLLEEVE